MGAPQPFKGSRQEWLDANGWRHEVVASDHGWELRFYPDIQQVRIAKASSQLFSVVVIEQGVDGWMVKGTDKAVPAHVPFLDPRQAFRWWLDVAGK